MATSSGNGIFYYWVSNDTTRSTTGNQWDNWTNSITTSDTGDSTVWVSWQGDTYVPVQTQIPQISAEEKRARAAQAKERDRRIKEEDQRKEKAEITAQALLEDLISEKQLKYYKETGRLIVKGRESDYVIKKEGGVFKVEKDKITDLCIHLREQYKYPRTDNVIALKLLLETDEQQFLKTANNHGEIGNSEMRKEILEMIRKAA